jgi:hypothetical protein
MTEDSILSYRLEQAELKIVELEDKLVAFIVKEDARETKRLLWGISALGTAVMILGSIIWTYRPIIFKG